MSSYMFVEENNVIVETMMLRQSCNHVTGDDTNEKGFKLIVDDPDDKDCDCQVVRSLRPTSSINIEVNGSATSLAFSVSNKLINHTNLNLYGGGLISAFTHRQTRTSTIRCFLSWSDNLFIGATLSTPVASIPPLSRGSGWFPIIFGGGGQ